MVAHAVAAAWCYSPWCFVWLFVCVLYTAPLTFCLANNHYSRQDLFFNCEQSVTAEFFHSHNIPVDLVRIQDSLWIIIPDRRLRRWRRERRQKRGCMAGTLVRLRRQSFKPPFPRLFLAYVRTPINKMDELRVQVAAAPSRIVVYRNLASFMHTGLCF